MRSVRWAPWAWKARSHVSVVHHGASASGTAIRGARSSASASSGTGRGVIAVPARSDSVRARSARCASRRFLRLQAPGPEGSTRRLGLDRRHAPYRNRPVSEEQPASARTRRAVRAGPARDVHLQRRRRREGRRPGRPARRRPGGPAAGAARSSRAPGVVRTTTRSTSRSSSTSWMPSTRGLSTRSLRISGSSRRPRAAASTAAVHLGHVPVARHGHVDDGEGPLLAEVGDPLDLAVGHEPDLALGVTQAGDAQAHLLDGALGQAEVDAVAHACTGPR